MKRVSLLLVAFVLGACGGANDQPATQGELPALVIPEGRTEFAIPFAGGIFESVDLSSKVFKAEQQAIALCMKENGFKYTPINLEKLAADENRNLFRHTDRDAAAEKGFGVVEPVDGAWRGREDGPNPASLDSMSEDEADKYYSTLGDSEMDPGCKQEAKKAVLGAFEVDGNPISHYETKMHNDAITFLRHSQEYRDAMDAWKSCLKESGVEAHHPAYLRDSTMKARPAPNVVTEEEKKIAVIYVDCVNRANLVNVQNGVMEQAEEWVVSQNEGLFLAVAELRRNAEKNTVEIS